MPKPTRSRAFRSQKLRLPGVFLIVGHLPPSSPSVDHHSLVSLFQNGIRTQRCTKRSNEGKHLSKCAEAQEETFHLFSLCHQSIVANDGCWTLFGPTSHGVFKEASASGELRLMKENLLGELTNGSLVFAKLVVHIDLSVSVMWHRVWNI